MIIFAFMINEGLLALAELILPHEILKSFAVATVENTSSVIRIHLDELPSESYSDTSCYESKGFLDAVTLRDFPIRNKAVDLIVRRRRWLDKQTGKSFSKSYDLKADGTRYSKEFAAFLKGVYGDDPYDLPFA